MIGQLELGRLSRFSVRLCGVYEGLCKYVNDCWQTTGKRPLACNGHLTHDGSTNFFGYERLNTLLCK